MQSVKGLFENGCGFVLQWLGRRRERIFWVEFKKSVVVDAASGCWVWIGKRWRKGYGVYRGGLAYSVAWFACGRQMEFGFSLHHVCFNKRCVNPDHLVSIPGFEHRRIHAERWRAGHFLGGEEAVGGGVPPKSEHANAVVGGSCD